MRGTVLIVNSFVDGREMYADYLRAHGLAVCAVVHPDDALAKLNQLAPDVVVTDLVFLGQPADGPTFIRTLRERVDPATSLIVVSGYARQEDRNAARAAGADLYLVKPVLPSAVLDEVRRALALRRRGERLPWNWPTAVSDAAVSTQQRPHKRRT